LKTLVVSLLRAGDILMQRPLLASLKGQNPSSEIHILMNDEVSWIAPLINADKVHFFPRKTLQRLMGEADHHIVRANQELQNFFEALNQEFYDEILNLTHTRLSAFISEEIQAPIKKGLVSAGQKIGGLDNAWMKLFNDRFASSVDFGFHYSEILAESFGIELNYPQTQKRDEFKRIFLQVYTSDSKKNWNILNFRQLLDKLYSLAPDLRFQVLATEKEKEILRNYFEEEEICTWNMVELSREFCASDILITGDTSVMHLAAQNGTQVIELALGSSDPWRTGPLGEGHIVLQPRAACYPCPHSKPCRQISHLCGDDLSAKFVSRIVDALINNKELPASTQTVKVQTTHVDDETGWWLEGDTKGGTQLMNKILWKYVNREGFVFGKEVILNLLKRSLPSLEQTQNELKEKLFKLQDEFEILIQKLGNGEISVTDVQRVRREMSSIKASPQIQELLWGFADLAQLPFATPLHFLSAFQDKLEQLKAVVYHREQLLQQMKAGGRHEPGTGKVSGNSFAET
jgi:ADP-heptose:LPS heptosyltransferase